MALAKQTERERILQEANAAYARLRTDEDEWMKLQEERTLWDNTLLDGFDEELGFPTAETSP